MPFTRKELFLKAFWWALIGSALFVGVYLTIISVGNVLRLPSSGGSLVNGVLYASLFGNLLGAGLVGWRVAEKYQHNRVGTWLRRYFTLALISMALATAMIYSPFSFFVVLWGLLSAAFVLRASSDTLLFSLSKTRK